MQLDPPKTVSPWSDRITLFPKSVADRASLVTTLDLFARVPDALGDRDIKIVNKSVSKGYTLLIDDVIKSDSDTPLDLSVRVEPSGRGTLGIKKMRLTCELQLWAEIDLSEIDLLAEGMMLSASIREALRVLQPAPADALAILQGDNADLSLDIELLETIAKVFSSEPESVQYMDVEIMDPVISGSLLTTNALFYSQRRGQRLNIDGAPRVRYARSYDPISRAFGVQYFRKSAIPKLVNDLGDYAFVSVLNKGRAVAIDGATRLNIDEYSPAYDTLTVMNAISKLDAIKNAIQEDAAA